MHNTYYNNMVCYINNKQSDTDSHQSKVNNHRSQSDICKLYWKFQSTYNIWFWVRVTCNFKSNYCISLFQILNWFQIGDISLWLKSANKLLIVTFYFWCDASEAFLSNYYQHTIMLSILGSCCGFLQLCCHFRWKLVVSLPKVSKVFSQRLPKSREEVKFVQQLKDKS